MTSRTLLFMILLVMISPGLCSKKSKTEIIVRKDGKGDFTTINRALSEIGHHNKERVFVRIHSGKYLERVVIPKKMGRVSFMGEGNPCPVISWNDTATSSGSTWNSSTVMIEGDEFIAKHIVFENTAPAPVPGAVGAQAVAVRITGDKAAFFGCRFLGAQDTLYDMKGRHYFKNCFIQGSIDFIFGDGQSIYEDSTLHSIAKSMGSLTAQYRQSSDEPTGYAFLGCNVTGTGSIYLGRAWGPASKVVFANSYLSVSIKPAGWSDWGEPSRDNKVYYGEYNNSGPGANMSGRVKYAKNLTLVDVQPFLDHSFIMGDSWIDPEFA